MLDQKRNSRAQSATYAHKMAFMMDIILQTFFNAKNVQTSLIYEKLHLLTILDQTWKVHIFHSLSLVGKNFFCFFITLVSLCINWG